MLQERSSRKEVRVRTPAQTLSVAQTTDRSVYIWHPMMGEPPALKRTEVFCFAQTRPGESSHHAPEPHRN